MALPFNYEQMQPSGHITSDLTHTTILRNIATTMNTLDTAIQDLGIQLRELVSALTYVESFQIKMDLKHHAVEKICLKIGDGFVVLKARCEIIACRGKRSYQITKRFSIPKGHSLVEMTAHLSVGNMLTISARLQPGKQGQRIIPIILISEAKPKGDERHGEAGDAAPGEHMQ